MRTTMIGCAIALVLLLVCEACSNNISTQRITGAGDCISCYGWSWSNGVATATRENSSFSFKSNVSGELIFEYQETFVNYSWDNRLEVYVLNKTYFDKAHESGGDDHFTKSSLGSINAGDTVKFYGKGYKVKDIKIVGTPGQTDNNKTQWDF